MILVGFSLPLKGKQMVRIVIFMSVAALLAFADAPVLQTGQVKSYDMDGIVVTDGSIKDDGYYRAGKARSYGRSGNVVKDNATGLEWQDNESILKPWTETGGDTAANYCASLPPSGEWRLPAIQELQTLVDYSQFKPAVTEGLFTHISSSYYWSSTTNADYTDSAWIGGFNYGHSNYTSKTFNSYVRCVQGGQLAPSNISRDDVVHIVTDAATGLQWQDDTVVETTERNWVEALDYCENTLTLGGHSDWRLPNQNELFSIVEYSQHNPAINSLVFVHTAPLLYWSSTTTASTYNTDWAWLVYFNYGYSSRNDKSSSNYVRCVRGGQLGHSVNPSIIMYLLN